MDDFWVLFVMSLPFLGIFIIGCHSMYLLNMIYDELDQRAKDEKERGLRQALIDQEARRFLDG